jgi:hypothetical protein
LTAPTKRFIVLITKLAITLISMDENFFIKTGDFAGLCKHLRSLPWRCLSKAKFAKCEQIARQKQSEIANSEPAKRFSQIIDDVVVAARKKGDASQYAEMIEHLRDEWRAKFGQFENIYKELVFTEVKKEYARKYRKEFGFTA